MYSITKEWKEFRVFLPDLVDWLRDNVGQIFSGLTADYVLNIWFTDQPGYEVEGAIEAYWDDLTEEGEDAKWAVFSAQNAAVEAARQGLLTASFDDLIPAERKMLLNMLLNDDDRAALLVKYPQA